MGCTILLCSDLEYYGWEPEKTLEKQTIDAYKEFQSDDTGYYLTEERFRELIKEYLIDHEQEELEMFIAWLNQTYQAYHKRSLYSIDNWPDKYKRYFSASETDTINYKIGVEFETGNIASSFRAFSKLNTLYQLNCINVGIFITTDKESARNIWPPSNRNGSYEELENRQYRSNILFPIWEFLFKPDRYSQEVGYLGADGKVYNIIASEKQEIHNGKQYKISMTPNGEKILSLVDDQFSLL
jgi:hypothetical protein